MKAVVYHGVGDISLDDVAEPRIEAQTDAIVRITASAKFQSQVKPVTDAIADFKAFDRRERSWIKVELQPQRGSQAAAGSDENIIDKAVADTFPASDPTSMQNPR